jgi:hypothetical protein
MFINFLRKNLPWQGRAATAGKALKASSLQGLIADQKEMTSKT